MPPPRLHPISTLKVRYAIANARYPAEPFVIQSVEHMINHLEDELALLDQAINQLFTKCARI